MQVADRATGGTKDQLRALTEISKVATEALKHVKVTATQAMESKVSAESILQGVKGIGEEARQAARDLDRVHLSQAQAAETRIVAAEQVRALKDVEHQAIKTRAATSGGGVSGGGFGMPLPPIMPAAIGGAALLAPAAGPGVLGLLGAIPVLATSGAGALGALVLGFQGVTKAIMGNKKAFDGLVPEQQQFVLTIRSLDGWFRQLKQTVGAAMFPGLTAGLKAALSPGTVQAITQAMTAFGQAIGAAGKMWGQYFGSSQFQQIFGPLMQAGAKNLGLMSSAVLHLFDAMGVLGRAAIPLTEWMVKGADAGARWVDSFARAKDATGGLNGAMNEAKTSLQLVGRLFASLLYVVYELGKALYPVSKVAVKALTDGLFVLGQIIDKNKGLIREIVGVLLSAFVGAVKVAARAVSLINGALSHLVGGKSAIVMAILGIGAAMLIAFGPEAVAVTGAIVAIGLIQQHWAAFSTWVVNIFKWVARQIGSVFSLIPSWINPGLNSLGKSMVKWGESTGSAVGSVMGASLSQAFQGALNLKSLAGGGFNTDLLTGKANPAALASGGAMSAKQIAAMAKAHGLDPQAVLAVAKMEGLGGGIGDGGHAFGPFQLNNAGGVITNMFPGWSQAQIQKWAWSKQGVNFALQKMAGVAAGQTGYGAINSIVTGFERPMNPGKEIAGAWNAYSGGAGGAGSPFGAIPPWTTGLGPKPKKPSWQMPALYSAAMNNASANASRASTLGNTGGTAQRYLEHELANLHTAEAALDKAIASDNGKHKARLLKAEVAVENKIRDVQKKIANAIIIAGDALLPDKLNAKLKQISAQFTADSDYAQVLTGETADKYRKTLQRDLLNKAAIYQTMLDKLKQRLVGSTGKQRTAIQSEITKIQGSLDGVQQQILANLQGVVQMLQGQVSTAFASVQAEMQTQLGNKFFQNGLKTPAEAALAAMQTQDQLQSQLDAVQQAKDQLAQDQAGSLTSVVFDAATGITKNNYSSAGLKQIAADQKALDAANRQYDEYMLGVKAAQERSQADKQYADQTLSMNKQLSRLAEAFQNGTGSMQALRDVAAQYGIQISTATIPSFDDLAKKSDLLKQAFIDLVNYISTVTGTTPKIPVAGSDGSGGGGGAGGGAASAPGSGSSPAGVLQNLHAQVVNGIISPETYHYLISGHKLNIPGMARGGIVKAKPGGTLVRLAEAGQDEEVGPVGGRGGGGVVVNLSVSALDPSSVDWSGIADKIQAELLRKQRRNGNTVGIR